jgi:hypothetical protein
MTLCWWCTFCAWLNGRNTHQVYLFRSKTCAVLHSKDAEMSVETFGCRCWLCRGSCRRSFPSVRALAGSEGQVQMVFMLEKLLKLYKDICEAFTYILRYMFAPFAIKTRSLNNFSGPTSSSVSHVPRILQNSVAADPTPEPHTVLAKAPS